MRTAYHRNHLRQITGPSEEELACGLPVNFIVGGFFPDVPTTKGAYHKGDAWGEGEKLHKSRYAGFRGDADPSNVSGLDDEEAYLPWLGTEWDVGGRGKGFNPNRYISRAAGAFTPRGGFRTGLSLDSYGTPVGAIASEFSGEDDEGDMVDFSMTGAGIGRGFNAPGLYKASRGSFGRKQGLRGSFLDGNPAQVGGYAADIGTYSDAVQSGAIASEFNDAYEDEEDAAMVDFSWTGAGPGRGFNRRGLYGVGRGGFVRREGFRGNFLDGNPVQVGSAAGRDIKHAEHLKQITALLAEIKATGKVPTNARLQAIASVFSIIPGGKPSPVDATWKWIAWLEKTKAKLESKVGAMQETAEEKEAEQVRRYAKRRGAIVRAAEAFKEWATDELIPTFSRFADTDGNAFGYIVELPSENDRSDANSAAQRIARRHNTHYVFVGRDEGFDVGEDEQVVIFSDNAAAAIFVPAQFSVSGFDMISAKTGALFGKLKERLQSFAGGGNEVKQLEGKVKRLKKQLGGAEAQLAAAKADGDGAKSEEAESGRIAVGFLGKRKGQAAEGKVVLSAGKYDISKRTEDADEDDDEDAPAAPAYDHTLSDGDEGESVKVLQRALNAGPGFNLSIDGDFGPSTTAAVRTFQKSAQITADGVFGPDTLVALNRNLKGHGKPTVRFSGSDLVVGGLAGSGYPFDESGALDLDDLREEAEEAQDAYDDAVREFRARRGSASAVREAGHRKAQTGAAYTAAQEEAEEGGTVIRSSGFTPMSAQYAMTAAGLPGMSGVLPSGGFDVGKLSLKTGKKAKKKRKARQAERKATKAAGRPKMMGTKKWGKIKAGKKPSGMTQKRWGKLQAGKKPIGMGKKKFGKIQAGLGASSSMSKTRPTGSGSGVTHTRPKGLGASVPTTSRAQPGAGTPPGALPLSTDPGMIPLIPPKDPMMDPMMPPPGGEMGGGGGGPMGGGGGGGEPPGGGGGGGPMGGGGDEPEDDDYDFGDQEEIEDEQDPGFQIIDLGGDEEEEEPDAQFISLDGDEEEGEEDTDTGVRVIPMPRPGFGRFGFMGPSVKAPGKHGRAIGVNPMGQTIYESGRIVIGSVGHSEDEDDGHYDDIYYDEDSYYDDAEDDEDDSGLIGLSPGDLEADPQSYIDIDFGDGHSEEIETGNIDFADLVGAHPHPRLRRARARAQGRGRGPRAHPKHPPHPQTPPPRRRRPGWKKRQLGRGPR